MLRLITGIVLLVCFGVGSVNSVIKDKSSEEAEIDLMLCSVAFGLSGTFLAYSGYQYLKKEKIILDISLSMVEEENCIDVEELSYIIGESQVEVIKFLKKAQIDNLIKKKAYTYNS